MLPQLDVKLTQEDFSSLVRLFRLMSAAGQRYPEHVMAVINR